MMMANGTDEWVICKRKDALGYMSYIPSDCKNGGRLKDKECWLKMKIMMMLMVIMDVLDRTSGTSADVPGVGLKRASVSL